MGTPSMKDLLEAGVHFGHQTRKWNPKMKPYIFQERNGIHIIDLLKTIDYVKDFYERVKEIAREGGNVLFVGTKKQASKAIEDSAKRCGMFYVSNRWLGGMLTNFTTVKQSIARLKRIERMEVDGTFDNMIKKERLMLLKEKTRLEKNFAGIKDMEEIPSLLFVIDPVQEAIAVNEARKCNIPIAAVIDTNCDPDLIDFPIPGNDDAIRAITLFSEVVADAVIEGQNEAGKESIAEGILNAENRQSNENTKEDNEEKASEITTAEKTEEVAEKKVEETPEVVAQSSEEEKSE